MTRFEGVWRGQQPVLPGRGDERGCSMRDRMRQWKFHVSHGSIGFNVRQPTNCYALCSGSKTSSNSLPKSDPLRDGGMEGRQAGNVAVTGQKRRCATCLATQPQCLSGPRPKVGKLHTRSRHALQKLEKPTSSRDGYRVQLRRLLWTQPFWSSIVGCHHKCRLVVGRYERKALWPIGAQTTQRGFALSADTCASAERYASWLARNG